MTDLSAYRDFIASKGKLFDTTGMTPRDMLPALKHHQAVSVDFALRKGRAALFLDTGLGKSLCELEWARQVVEHTNRPVIILTPLAVAAQMVREGDHFGIAATQIRDQSAVTGPGIYVANYERLPHLDCEAFGGVVLDESSILKSFTGSTKRALVEQFAGTPFRLAATATPAPNDHMELGTHAEFLGIMGRLEMLSRWFINDTSTASQDWRLKKHAVRDFWSWVASWSRCASLPSDLGGDDAGYVLPPVERRVHVVEADITEAVDDGMLFRIPEMSATSFHREKRLTLDARVERAAELASHGDPVTVWCETNEESARLAAAIDGAVEVRGDMTPEEKERRLIGFATGEFRAIVTKPKLAGFGVNWQHCAHAVFASISFSYEQHYQAVRRSQRFGQSRQVVNDIVISDTERTVWETVTRKSRDHDGMKAAMAEAMRGVQNESGRTAYARPADVTLPTFMRAI